MAPVKHFSWPRLVITAAAAGSTYYLRSVLAYAGLQPLTYLLPVLLAAYLFGSVMAALATIFTLIVVHGIVWAESPRGIVFTQQYFAGIFSYALLSAAIVWSSWRREQVLARLDESLAREKEAREEAEAANRLKDQFLATLSHEL